MKNTFRFQCLIFILFTIPTFTSAANPDALDKLMQEAVKSNTVPGISIAVADKTGVIYAKGFGYSDLEKKVPMTANTKLRIGSISKVMTTAALMRMVEDNKVNLSTNIEDLVSEWPKSHDDFNFYHLTGHTAGIRHYANDEEFFSNVQYGSRVESLSIFKNDSLKFKPGTQSSYSTYAWTLVSAAMEKADGSRNFNTLMNDYVFKPLKLENTLLENNAAIIENRQGVYTANNGKLENSLQVNNSYKLAGGGILSTPSDVVTFAMAHTDNKFLKEETIKQIFTNQTLADGTKLKHGIGWRVGFDELIKHMEQYPEYFKDQYPIVKRHRNAVFHSGGSMGSTSMLIMCLEHNIAVAISKNVDGDRSADLMSLALKALDIASQK